MAYIVSSLYGGENSLGPPSLLVSCVHVFPSASCLPSSCPLGWATGPNAADVDGQSSRLETAWLSKFCFSVRNLPFLVNILWRGLLHLPPLIVRKSNENIWRTRFMVCAPGLFASLCGMSCEWYIHKAEKSDLGTTAAFSCSFPPPTWREIQEFCEIWQDKIIVQLSFEWLLSHVSEFWGHNDNGRLTCGNIFSGNKIMFLV